MSEAAPEVSPEQIKPAAGRIVTRIRVGFLLLSFVIQYGLIIVYRLFGDLQPWSEYLTIWPPVLWLFGLVPLAILSFDRQRKLITSTPFLGILFFLVYTVEWHSLLRMHPLKPPPGATEHLRIVSWNISDATGGERIYLDKLAPLKPDLCLFQETPDRPDAFDAEDLVGYFKDFHWLDGGDCGILSRYPMEPLKRPNVGPWDPPLPVRMILPNGKRLTVINVRLMLPSLVLNPFSSAGAGRLVRDHVARTSQFESLGYVVTSLSAGCDFILVAGDFNTPGGAFSLHPLAGAWIDAKTPGAPGGLRDAWPIAGRGYGATITQSFPVCRIDQAWSSAGLEPIDAHTENGSPSDHQMLVVDYAY